MKVLEYKLVKRSKILKYIFPKWVKAFTFNNIIFIKDDNISENLLSHELIHVKQYKENGILKFLVLYFYHYFKNLIILKNSKLAYLMIPFEIEAYMNETKGDN